ncbi:neurogenic locus notch homolog protein 1-like [Ruditapes philippinarum]|uniref:neurogenic locus notch homolog protein 1-like n=1 Tax=Ruditapes philippinarum TaxID=129788 RepID=UPI00295A624C|nr:neurogenic locus notch homolog protein 1-like [Ruditapes philippinarum]
MNYCFRGLENTQNNTLHIVSNLPAEDTAPLDIKLEIHPVNENRKKVLTFNIPVINFTKNSVVGNSYRHFHAAEIERRDKLTGVGFKIGLFVWCSTGYTGKRCEEKCNSTELDCNYEKCQSGEKNKYAHTIHCAQGMCNDSTKLCDCDPGYIGPVCKTHLDYCKFGWAENPCLNGKCTNHANGFTCECSRHYTGKFCEIRLMTHANTSRSKREVFNGSIILPAKSASNRAKNVTKQCPFSNSCGNGTSFVFKDTLKCICDFGFTGAKCKEVDHCASKPCLYGGLCQNMENTFSCKCQNGFRGIKCGMVNECEDSFCQNNSTCMNITSSNIKCICKKGFTGKFCQVKTFCETKTCTNETKCNDHDTATQTCFTPKTTNHSMQKLFVKLLPALRPEGIDEDNITDSVKMLLENITQNCGNVRVMFDVFSFANGSSNIYIGVLCDGKLLSATLIGHQFKHFHTNEIINILHFVPKNNENSPAADVGHTWIEDNWIILIGILVAVVAVLIGLVKSLHIIYGIRPDRRVKRKVTTIRKRNNYIDVFEKGTTNLQNTDETNKPHIYSSGLGSSYVIYSPSGRQDNLQQDKSNGYTSSVYNVSAKPSLSNDAKFINASQREHGTEAVHDEELRGPHYEARFPSPLLDSEQNYRNSYIDSKMAFLARNPIRIKQ